MPLGVQQDMAQEKRKNDNMWGLGACYLLLFEMVEQLKFEESKSYLFLEGFSSHIKEDLSFLFGSWGNKSHNLEVAI